MQVSDLISALNWRYATKQFDSNKKISDANVAALKDSIKLSASSFGLQPYRIIAVKDSDIRNELMANSWNQKQVTDSSCVFVFTVVKSINENYVDNFMKLVATKKGIGDVSQLNGYKQMIMGFVNNLGDGVSAWAARQAYIALGTLLTSAALLKIDTCPMEGVNAEKYNEILKINDNYTTICVCALGYRSENDVTAGNVKVRREDDDLFVSI
jgi:nitroreductase